MIKKYSKSILALFFSVFFILNFNSINCQTLIDPTGDGGFETGATFALNGWTTVNAASNYWLCGNLAPAYAGARGAHISQTGAAYDYINNAIRTSHFYRDVNIPTGATAITLSFYWKGNGESNWDRMLVYTAPNTVTPVANSPASNSTAIAGATLVWTQVTFPQAAYTLATIALPDGLAGTTVRIIFTWQNDASLGTSPGAAVDNISLTYTPPDYNNYTLTYSSSTFFTAPLGVTSLAVECWGAGGGGGGSTAGNDGGGGGGGGGYSKGNAVAVTSGTSYAVNVGLGGYQYTTTSNIQAYSGGDSWFKDVSTVLAKGGTGGFNTNTVALTQGAGGTGGALGSGIGDIRWSGANGGDGRDNATGRGGAGGASGGTAASGTNEGSPAPTWDNATADAAPAGGGIGGNGGNANGADGANGTVPGGGGGGGAEAAYGGDGANGQVIISYTCISITTQPSNQTLCSGGSAEFNIVSSAPSLTYQWQYNGVDVADGTPVNAVYSGSNTASLSISGAIGAGAYADYTCVLTNSCGSVTSSSVTLTVSATVAPATPANPTISALDCDVTVTRTGAPPGGETWYWQGTDCGISTALGSGATYNATTSETYYIRSYLIAQGCWSPSCGSVDVSAMDRPTIISEPSSAITGCNSTSITFTIVSSGAGLSFQWQEFIAGWLDITDGGVYSGATTESLIISDPTGFNGRQYRCVVTGYCTPTATSTAATLTVLANGLSGLKTIPGNYATLKAAFDDINTKGLIGNLELQITASIVDNNEASLNQWNNCGNSGYTVTIYPTGVGPWTLSGSVATSLVTLNGADYVTFNGKLNQTGAANNLILSNTNTSGSAIKFINDATYNTIEYCTLLGVSTTSTTGVAHFSTASSTGNDYNTITYCDIKDGASNPKVCIYGYGTFGSENDNNTISNNNIYNFYIASGIGYGIRVLGGNTKWTISGNSVYQTSARNATDFYGIYVVNSLGGEYIIEDNFIGGNAASCGGATLNYTDGGYSPYFRGIYLSCSTTGISYIKNNTIKNISFQTSPSRDADFLFFPIMAADGRIDVTGNTIGDASTGSITLTVLDNSTYKSINMGIYKEGDGNVINNNIGSIELNGTSGDECVFYGIQILGTLLTDALVSGNTIGHATTASSIRSAAGATPAIGFIGILFGTTGDYKTSVVNNTISNINLRGTGTIPWFQGMDNEAEAGSQIVQGNTVCNITNLCTTTSTFSIIGYRNLNLITGGVYIRSNKFHSFTSSGAATVSIAGILHYGPTTLSNNIQKNIIHSLSTSSSASYIYGIYLGQGPCTVSNNMIRLGIDKDGVAITTGAYMYGIYKNMAENANFYFNSVYIGGNTAVVANTYAFRRVTTGVDVCRNNIFYNARTGSGIHYAIYLNANTTFTSNYNDLYFSGAGEAVSNAPAGSTFANWQAWNAFDANGFSSNPSYVNPTGNASTVDLELQVASTCIGKGWFGTGILDDYENEQRKTGVNPNGPCIGADEYIATAGYNSYGIYLPAAQTNSNILDCEIYATGGTPGGIGILVANPTTVNYANVDISGYQIITQENVQCMNSEIEFNTASGSPDWLMGNGSAPSSGSISPMFTQYTSTGRKDIIENVKVFRDFANITMAVPDEGTILGAPSGAGCPTTYSYTSSEAGSAGFTYAWSAVTPGGCTTTIATPTASTSDITFVNLTGYNQVFVLQLDITTECCGPLTQVKRYITIYPAPVAPTVDDASPNICTGGSITLSVAAPLDPSYSYDWYNAVTGPALLGSGSTYNIATALTGANSYFAQATNSYGCSSDRTEVVVTGDDTTIPTVPDNSTCGDNDVTLSITGPVAGYTYNWYSVSCGGTLEQTSMSTTFTTTVSATTTFYVEAVPPGCGASACQTPDITYNAPPNPVVWLGAVGGANNWFNSANWTSGCIPACNANVSIPNLANDPDIGFNATNNAACQDINLQVGAVLSFSDSRAMLDVCGNFTHAGIVTTNDFGKINFVSTSSSQTYTRTGTGSLNSVEIDNTFTTPTVTINSADMILGSAGTLTLSSGRLVTGANNIIITNTAFDAVSGHSTSSYVYGNLRRYVVAPVSYDFPVGNSTSYQLANLNISSVTGLSYITTSFANPGSATGTGLPITETCYASDEILNNGSPGGNGGVWTVTPDAGSANYTLTLYGRNYDNLGLCHTLVSRANSGVAWGFDGSTHVSQSVAGGVVTATRNGFTGFSEKAIVVSPVVLPIQLIYFSSICKKYNELSWATATEVNNNYFIIEKSYDGINFSFVEKINGSGNSNSVKTYSYVDYSSNFSLVYYRLKQVDFSGDFSYSDIISTICNTSNELLDIFKSNSNDLDFVIKNAIPEKDYKLMIYDQVGKCLVNKNIKVQYSEQNISLEEYLSSGIYNIVIRSADDFICKQFVIYSK